MSDDERPPFEASEELSQYLQSKLAELDEEFGLEPRAEPSFSHWPELTARIYDAALFWHRDPTQPLVKIGRFEAIALLGEGGFGSVFKARDPQLDRFVALKLCRLKREGTEAELMREARALAKLKHPNIVVVYEVGRYEEENAFFIVTEFVQATRLREYTMNAERSWEELVDIFSTVGEAVVAAHEAGVIHGDLKPANVILDEESKTPYIIDFGLARMMEADVATLVRGGTLPYMAPELLRGGERDELSDQYAFCVSLWRCLGGRHPYAGRNTEELLADIEIGKPNLVELDARMPEPVREVLQVGLLEDPAERFPDMRALLDALARARGPRVVEGVELEVQSEPSAPKARPKMSVIKGGLIGILLVAATPTLAHLAERLSGEEPTPPVVEPVQDPVGEALRGFAVAEQAARAGDVRGCYDAWRIASSRLVTLDPQRDAVLSLELANRIAEQSPGQVAAAWIAVSAANSFEIAAVGKTDGASLWMMSSQARGRAAELYAAAREPEMAKRQRRCASIAKDEMRPCPAD